MSAADPLQPLLALGDVASLADSARRAVAAVHRRPVSLRRAEVTGSESVLRGARTSALIDDPTIRLTDPAEGALGASISVSSMLAPDSLQSSARVFGRAPLQILARMSVSAGGGGRPEGSPERLQRLAALVSGGVAHDVLLPQVVHAEILGHRLFGERSGLISRAAGRLAAVSSGFDPRGLAVPEPYLLRHRAAYVAAAEAWAEGSAVEFLELSLRSWIAGAEEAEAIARAL
ncbi:MAG: hypothetical protein Q4G50_00670 [Corynebacterium sp.]|uniref:hypothetical protein n=1 Tax=Corynebacterium sp. TaxID=1720 RepID=UPI0026DFFF3C|nr:hypothetical protein [Corynebacterium sp.]MDO5668495.1 hypothetical protein [Corynebacterium sp.]